MKDPIVACTEPLEPRIAPAPVIGLTITDDGKIARWRDTDGDFVTLTASKGILDDSDFVWRDGKHGDFDQLALLDLSNDNANGASLIFSAHRDRVGKVGDGFVHVGWINARTTYLGTVIVPGDLARFDAGDLSDHPAALNVIVHSAGLYDVKTQGAPIAGGAPTTDWSLFGRLGALTVKTDFLSNLKVLGPQANPGLGSTGAITIRGDLIGGSLPITASATDGTGYLFSTGNMGPVKIGGGVFGSAKPGSGLIRSLGTIASVTVGGSLQGWAGDWSGSIFADKALGPVTIKGNVTSGFQTEDENGEVFTPLYAGAIGSATKIGQVTITGNVQGGSSFFGGSVFTLPGSGGRIDGVSIGGTLSGGTQVAGTGQDAALVFNGIYSDSTLGPVKVGALSGHGPPDNVHIVARGALNPTTAAGALAIASVTVMRGAYSAEILAGFTPGLVAVNPDVQIGPVKVNGNWISSNIAAGVASTDLFFGNADDKTVVAKSPVHDDPAIHSKLLSVTISGFVFGSGQQGQVFAFEAQEIGAVRIGVTPLEMTLNTLNGPRDDFILGVAHDFRVLELA